MYVCMYVCLPVTAFSHYCRDPDVSWGMAGVPPVVHYWADLQLVHGFRCYDNTTRTRNVSECLYLLYACSIIVLLNYGEIKVSNSTVHDTDLTYN